MENYRSFSQDYLTKYKCSQSLCDNERLNNTDGWLWEETGGYNHPQPGSGLIQYGMGMLANRAINPSVIYSTYLNNGKAVKISNKVIDWLASSGIRRLIVGHQPNGDAPWILKCKSDKHNNLEVRKLNFTTQDIQILSLILKSFTFYRLFALIMLMQKVFYGQLSTFNCKNQLQLRLQVII